MELALKEFSKKDLKSGMIVVENNGLLFQVIGDYLVNHLNSVVQGLEDMEEDMTFSNSLCNASKVFEPTQKYHYIPPAFSQDLGDFKKVYDRSESEERKRQREAEESRKRLLIDSMEELEEKLKMVREDFEKEFGDD